MVGIYLNSVMWHLVTLLAIIIVMLVFIALEDWIAVVIVSVITSLICTGFFLLDRNSRKREDRHVARFFGMFGVALLIVAPLAYYLAV